MYRCRALFTAFAVACAAPGWAQELARQFPRSALRGVVDFEGPRGVLLNGTAMRLSPGARLHGTDNMLVLSNTLTGTRHTVHYTLEDTTGQIKEVWILREQEQAVTPWPTTREQARSWSFNVGTQSWIKP